MVQANVEVVLALLNLRFSEVVDRTDAAIAGNRREWPELDEADRQRVQKAGWDDIERVPGRIIVTEGKAAKTGRTRIVLSGEASVEDLSDIGRTAVAVGYAGIGRVVDEARETSRPHSQRRDDVVERPLLADAQAFIIHEEKTMPPAVI